MKKNQSSLIQGIKVLGGAFAVYLLGLGVGNFTKNQKPLLVEVPIEVIVQAEATPIVMVQDMVVPTAKLDVLFTQVKYTCCTGIEKAVAALNGNMTNALLATETRRQVLRLLTDLERPTVTNVSIREHPRIEHSEINTS